jgi:hypothetical protein
MGQHQVSIPSLAYKPIVTVVDLLDSVACYSGVIEAVERYGSIAADTCKHAEDPYVAKAANANGYGDGSGSGDGSGYGDQQ